MIQKIRQSAITFGFSVGLLVVSGLVLLVLRFSNPDMTAMRMMLEFWKVFAVMIVGVVGIIWCAEGWK